MSIPIHPFDTPPDTECSIPTVFGEFSPLHADSKLESPLPSTQSSSTAPLRELAKFFNDSREKNNKAASTTSYAQSDKERESLPFSSTSHSIHVKTEENPLNYTNPHSGHVFEHQSSDSNYTRFNKLHPEKNSKPYNPKVSNMKPKIKRPQEKRNISSESHVNKENQRNGGEVQEVWCSLEALSGDRKETRTRVTKVEEELGMIREEMKVIQEQIKVNQECIDLLAYRFDEMKLLMVEEYVRTDKRIDRVNAGMSMKIEQLINRMDNLTGEVAQIRMVEKSPVLKKSSRIVSTASVENCTEYTPSNKN